MSDLYNRIVALCERENINISQMCSGAGITRGTMTDFKMGRTKTLSTASIAKIAHFFNVSTDYLLTGEEKENTPGKLTEGVKIPVFGRVAAGIPIEAIQEEVDWEDIPREWTRGGKEYFGLLVQGDSMYPKYLEDDIVIVRKTQEFYSGQDCIVYVNGYDATLKTVKKGADGSFTLIPFNREYAPKTYTRQEIRELPVVICGVVEELRRKM